MTCRAGAGAAPFFTAPAKKGGSTTLETGDRRWETGDRRREKGDRRQETGYRRRKTVEGKRETGDGRGLYDVQSYSVAEPETV